ncbi:MAG: putative ABC transporter permease, partial [Lachnospiraceae bacterium]|nr:putative ABC transporter permease [Lachnospiraceae bacterium]
MFHYNMTQWLFFFYTYCFLGWCFESAYVSICTHKLVNRGFLRGPFLPIYGSGAIMMYVVSMPFQHNIVLTYLAGCVGATALEYITGVLMETLFHIRYWDYSNKKFNFQGHICLSSTLAWGFFTIMMTRVIHRPIEQFVLGIPRVAMGYATFFLTICIVADFTLSFKTALDLRSILAKMQKAKEELEHMQKRLDVIIAFNNEEKAQKQPGRELRAGELVESLGQRFVSIKEMIQRTPGAYVDSIRDEIADLRARYNIYMENRKNYKEMLDFYKRDM